jgi:hypothetical protein
MELLTLGQLLTCPLLEFADRINQVGPTGGRKGCGISPAVLWDMGQWRLAYGWVRTWDCWPAQRVGTVSQVSRWGSDGFPKFQTLTCHLAKCSQVSKEVNTSLKVVGTRNDRSSPSLTLFQKSTSWLRNCLLSRSLVGACSAGEVTLGLLVAQLWSLMVSLYLWDLHSPELWPLRLYPDAILKSASRLFPEPLVSPGFWDIAVSGLATW